jgi:hypothetical protein
MHRQSDDERRSRFLYALTLAGAFARTRGKPMLIIANIPSRCINLVQWFSAEDRVYEVHRSRQVTIGIELRFPCLLQDKALDEREQQA